MRLLPVLALTTLLVGCGGDEPEPAPTQEPAAQPAQQPSAQQPAAEQPAAETGAETESPGATPGSETDARPAAPSGAGPETRVGDQRLYTVQVAAFLNAVTAREWADRLRGQDMPVWTSTATVEGRTFHRLRIGALPELSDTRRLADLIRDRYHWPVWIAPLTASDRLPVNAVQQTRAVLQRGR